MTAEEEERTKWFNLRTNEECRNEDEKVYKGQDGDDGYGKLSREWRGGRGMMMALLEGCRAIKMDEKWEMSGERI